jgi:hypothetical protein
MRRNSKLLSQRALVVAVLITSSTCGAVSAPAQDAPAEVTTISGEEASKLAALGYVVPVLVGRTGEKAAAYVFAENPTDLPALLESLLVPDIPGCVPEGAEACCDAATETFAIYTNRGAWLRLGEHCELSHPSTPDEPSDQPIAETVEVEPALWQKLFDTYGIRYDIVTFANSKGEPRVLRPASSESGDSGLLPPMLQRSAFDGSSPIILAHGHNPQGCVGSRPPSCCNTNHKRCHSNRRHWWVQVESLAGPGSEWCELADACRCC